MAGIAEKASASLINAGVNGSNAKKARYYLVTTNALALLVHKCRRESFVSAFRDMALVCQFFYRNGEFRDGTDALLYGCIREFFAGTFHESL